MESFEYVVAIVSLIVNIYLLAWALTLHKALKWWQKMYTKASNKISTLTELTR